jgi:putative peptidoglycan lipid II flippase
MTDAFNVAFRCPTCSAGCLARGPFSQAFVPVLGASKAEHGDTGHRICLIDRVATVLTWVLAVTCIVGVLAAPRWSGSWPAACSRTRGASRRPW